jgi:hypothetical protein
MKLECYAMAGDSPQLVPASPSRQWMDAFPERHAYRCLPLAIANTHGWEILSPCAFEATWTGGLDGKDITFRVLDSFPWLNNFVSSHFTHGIITFHTGYLFRTEPGWNLLTSGPFNLPKDGIAPLTGVIETDWLPYPFTMNWHFTRPGKVTWEKGEPFCLVFPVAQGALESVQPEIRDVEQNPELKAELDAWTERRDDFMKKFNAGDAETLKQAWQRYYFLGKLASTGHTVPVHTNKLRLETPVDRRQRGPVRLTTTVFGEFVAQPLSQLAMQEQAKAGTESASPVTAEDPISKPR